MVAFRSNAPRADLCCSGENILSCSRIHVSPKLVTSQQNLNILGAEFYFANRVEPHSYAYKNRWLDEAVLTYNKKTDTMFGSVHIQGRDYEIEKCHNAQWAKSGFFVQWVYWVYLSSQNTRPLCNAAMYEQV